VNVEEFISKWGFDINFEPLEELNHKFDEVQEKVLHIGEAAIAAAATMFGFAKLTADAGEKALLTSQQIGISAEAYQELAYAGKLVHLSSEEMSMGFVRLSRSMEEARKTGHGGVADVFHKLGMSITDSNGKLVGGDQVLMQLADRFHKMPDGAEKTAYAMEIFGRSGAKLIPILNKGSAGLGQLRQEAHDMGVVLDEETLKASEEFNQSLERAESAMAGVRNIVGAALLPSLTKLAVAFGNWVSQNRQLIALKINQLFEGTARFLKIIWTVSTSLFATFKGLVDVFGGFEKVAIAAGIAMGLFAAASVLASIGEMAMGVMALTEAITLANLSALAIPILIGAAVVAIGLVIEDIIGYFQGRDSVTGIIVDKFKEMFGWLEDKFQSAGAIWQGAIWAVLTPIRAMILLLRTAGEIWNDITGKANGSGVHSLTDTLGELFSPQDASLAGAFGMGKRPTLSNDVGVNPQTTPFYQSGGGNSSQQQTNHITAPVTIQMGEGANPSDVGRAARDGVNEGLDGVMRATMSSFAGSDGR
jgi:hypothetical protein